MEFYGFGIKIASLFNSAVDCFEHVQLSPNFGQDFSTSQLQLDTARLRLSRWGEAVNIYYDNYAPSFSTPNFRQAKKNLRHIVDLFTKAKRISNASKNGTNSDTELAIFYQANLMDSKMYNLHILMQNLAIGRRQNALVLQDMRRFQTDRWALYEKGRFNKLIEDITDLVGGLERIYPPMQRIALQEKLQWLCQDEVKIMGENADMSLLKDVIMDQDPCLSEAIKKSLGSSERNQNNFSFPGNDTRGSQPGNRVGNVRFPESSEINITSQLTDHGTAQGPENCSTDVTTLSTSAEKGVAVFAYDRDDKTYYSGGSEASNSKVNDFITEFTDQLLDKIRLETPDQRRRVNKVLPDLLRTFALKLGQNSEEKMDCDIMLLIHKHRAEIAARFEKSLVPQEHQISETALPRFREDRAINRLETIEEPRSDRPPKKKTKFPTFRRRLSFALNTDSSPQKLSEYNHSAGYARRRLRRLTGERLGQGDPVGLSVSRAHEATTEIRHSNAGSQTIPLGMKRASLWGASLDDQVQLATNKRPLLRLQSTSRLPWRSKESSRKSLFPLPFRIPAPPKFLDDQGNSADEGKEVHLPNHSVYHEYVVGTTAYQWLLAELKKEMLLDLESPRAVGAIRHTIISSLSLSQIVSAKQPTETRQLTFEVEWDLKKFLEEQQFLESPQEATTINQLMVPSKAIEKAITVTGSATDAQALTTEQYLRQTWPATGEWILKVVKDVVALGDGQRVSYTMPDNTRLTGWMKYSKFFVQAYGIGLSLAELGEQLSWLSTALRPSPYRDGIASFTPFIHDFRPDMNQTNALCSFSCRIDFNKSKLLQDPIPAEGQCWHNMFRNPVLVEGFPIPRRSSSDTGLEIPLNIMAALADTDYVTEFNRKPFIKGFSTMLVPTMMANDILVWHLLYAKDRERISYWDVTVPHLAVGKAELESKRHIVGWCSEAKLLAGTKHANYSLKAADLPRPSRDCLLDRATISGGYKVTAAFSFALGQAHKPVRVELSGYLDQLAWAHETFVVFWDENEKRGWLVNGTTALLHIVRTLLQHKCSGPFKSTILLEPNQIPEASDENKFGTDAALEVLCDVSNRIRPVQLDDIKIEKKTVQEAGGKPKETTEKKKIHTSFQDVVQRTCKVLEQMVDQQNPADRNGFSMKCRARKHIDGWDFESFLDKRTSYPSVATFEAMGHGWVDFIGGLGAVTLFAKGFGEIIEPTRMEGFCSRWAKLPKERYYLAACCSDLIKATKLPLMADSDLAKLSRSVKFSELCSCGYTSHAEQPTLLPHSSLQSKGCTLLPHGSTVSLQSQGAMIFSHNIPLKWRWKSPATGGLEDSIPSDVSEPLFDESAPDSSQARSSRIDTASESSQEHRQLPIQRSTTKHLPIADSMIGKSTEPEQVRVEESQQIITQEVPSGIGEQSLQDEQNVPTELPQRVSRDQSSSGETSTAAETSTQTLLENSASGNRSQKGRKHRARKLLHKLFKKE